MEALFFIALIIIIILLYTIKSRQKKTESRTHQSFLSLKKELLELKDAINNIPVKQAPVEPTTENAKQETPYTLPEKVGRAIVPTSTEFTPAGPQAIISSTATPIDNPQNALASKPVQHQYAKPKPTEKWLEKWLRNNPDLEKFIGENLINKIGITVLVLGIAFFVKYAIDQNWIKEAGRVGIGIGCGVVLTGLAHYLRNTYRSFSSVLAGGGIAVFYFTIAFAFHEYRLFSQATAFVIMIVITLFAVILSLLYDKLELAVIAAIGGFITPFLVSSGSGNYMVLFTYLLILNLGMLTLAYFKKWQAVNVIALFFTGCIYGGWLVQNTVSGREFLLYKNSLAFVSAFYALFLGMSMIHNIRTHHRFTAFDFSLLMLITFSYYAAGMANLHHWNEGEYQGLFTIAIGAVNFCIALYFYKSNKGDKNLLYLLIGLTLTFISLAAPVQLHGHTITLFWSAEFVLLYWLHQRSGIGIFKYSSFIILIGMVISLLMDWEKANDSGSNHLPVIYKSLQGFITNIAAIAAFTIYAILLRKEQKTDTYIAGIKNYVAGTAMVMIAVILLYLTCVFGVNLYFYNYQFLDLPNTWHQLISYMFIALLLWLIRRYQLSVNVISQVGMITSCVAMYLFSISYVINLRNGVLQDQYSFIHLWVHWLGALMFLYLIYQVILLYRKNSTALIHAWLINTVLILFFSVEFMHVYIFLTTPIQTMNVSLQQYSKAGLTIIWALYSFAIMWLGMTHKYKPLRIISLTLFSLALLKLFLLDIRNISEGGKIAAFIMLGILLLIISFMYQKLKKIIIDDAIS